MSQESTAKAFSVAGGSTASPTILIAVGENPEHQYGVQFAANFFHDFDQLSFRLLHLLPPEHGTLSGPYGLPVEGGRMDSALYDRHETLGKSSLQGACTRLIAAGVPEGNITTLSRPQDRSKALDLIQESAASSHHALVLGNRGRSWLEAALEGIPDITREVIDSSCGVPLWIAPSVIEARRNVLLCVDGSRPSLNMTRHVGRTLGSQGGHTVTMLRVLRDKNNNPTPPEAMFAACQSILEAEGVPADRIRLRIITENEPAKAILTTCEKGKFAVVAMGRAGFGDSFMRRLLMGSVSMAVMRQLRSACLWLTC